MIIFYKNDRKMFIHHAIYIFSHVFEYIREVNKSHNTIAYHIALFIKMAKCYCPPKLFTAAHISTRDAGRRQRWTVFIRSTQNRLMTDAGAVKTNNSTSVEDSRP